MNLKWSESQLRSYSSPFVPLRCIVNEVSPSLYNISTILGRSPFPVTLALKAMSSEANNGGDSASKGLSIRSFSKRAHLRYQDNDCDESCRWMTSLNDPKFAYPLLSSPNTSTCARSEDSTVCLSMSRSCKMLVFPELFAPNIPVMGDSRILGMFAHDLKFVTPSSVIIVPPPSRASARAHPVCFPPCPFRASPHHRLDLLHDIP